MGQKSTLKLKGKLAYNIWLCASWAEAMAIQQ